MKKRIILIVIASFMFMGVVSAASLWGNYKGNAIVKTKVNGADFKPSGVPAIIFNSQPLIPLSVLDKSGIKYKYDKAKQTIELTKTDSPKQLNSREQLYTAINHAGFITFGRNSMGGLEAQFNFYQRVDENADWDAILNVMNKLSKLDVDSIRVYYFDGTNLLGDIAIDKKHLVDFASGKVTDISTKYEVNGKLFRTPLTSKEIAKLMDRVGYVEAYNSSGTVFSTGSGFILEGGILITNHHVAEGSYGLRVKVNGTTYDNKGWYWFDNKTTDLHGTILSTSYDANGRSTGSHPNQFLELETNLPEIGDKVYAIGSPHGLENSISDGIVSGFRTIDGVQRIQHTADIDFGSSGGVLLNEFGDVVGVTSSGIPGSNLEFAIPAIYVQDELDKMK